MDGISDEKLAAMAQKGDKAAMERVMKKYTPMAGAVARNFHVPGADYEDLNQEGMIGLYRAVMGFDENRQTRFSFFARLCVERQIHSAVKSALRGKHSPLKAYIELSEADLGASQEPVDLIINREDKAAMERVMAENLSELETKALLLFIKGFSYAEIGESLGYPRKTVDNALSRVRKKLKQGPRI
ncbi:MAG: sigma-70 family RNA polymerase sigma factor [Clostridiales bacterium]|jgi:RNA polymerase sporulation-specific sigma factor|nr:sigma-70 family RNA polymerase sigma factor [Clostridiales bacterium]